MISYMFTQLAACSGLNVMEPWTAFVAGVAAGVLVFGIALALERRAGIDDPGDSIVCTLRITVAHALTPIFSHANGGLWF